LIGLPDEYTARYVAEGKMKTEYPIIIGGKNFGCGSSREHAPISLGAAGCRAVVANSFARIFFRNCIATGEVYPVEIEDGLNQKVKTGDEVEIDLENKSVKIISSGESCPAKDLGAVKEVIEAGGIFDYARNSGMIAKK
jgi:3-isopropylmalate/(R)-2-methylmalate dehydratase small subunit